MEFDCEVRPVMRPTASNERSGILLCGLRLVGEKRPAMSRNHHENRSGSDCEDKDRPSLALLKEETIHSDGDVLPKWWPSWVPKWQPCHDKDDESEVDSSLYQAAAHAAASSSRIAHVAWETLVQ
eukprot:3806960-Amphidinium_carterae.1